MLAYATSGGVEVFMAVVVAWGVLTLVGLFTRGGSGIEQRPWGGAGSGQAGAKGASVLDHDRVAASQLTRGTR